jgi:hypothetical protein
MLSLAAALARVAVNTFALNTLTTISPDDSVPLPKETADRL